MAHHTPATDHPDRWRVLVVCCVALFLLVSSLSALNVALPTIQRQFDASTSALQWIVDAYAVVFGGLLLTGGVIGDRIGRRPTLAGGLALLLIGGIIGGTAGSVAALIAARVVAGLGAALMMPATLSTLTDVFAPGEQARAIAIWAGVAGGGAAFGPLMSGWLLTISDWPAIFWLNVVIAAVGIVGVAAIVPRLPGGATGPLDLPGAAWSTLAIGAALYTVIAAPEGLTEPRTVAAAVIAVVATTAFVHRQRSYAHPMLPLRVFERVEVRAGVATLILAAVGFAGVLFVAALHLQIGWGESALVTGALLAPIGAVEFAVASRSPDIARRIGTGRSIAIGLVCMAAGYMTMALVPTGDRLTFVAAGVVAGIGNGLVIPASIDRVVGGGDPELAGVTAGLNETSIEIGASIGVAALGAVQRLVFASRLPAGAATESVERALLDVDADTVFAAFRAGSQAGLVTAAVAAVIAVPIALAPERRAARSAALRATPQPGPAP